MRSRPSISWLILGVLAALALGSPAAFAQAPPTQQPPPPPQPMTQSSGGEGFGIQIGGGPIFANFADTQGLNLESKAGWLFGILMGGNRSGTVGVEADVLYGKKGVTVSNVDLDTHVIHVPVMLKINGGSRDAEGLSFFGLGGGFFDWQFKNTIGGVDIGGDTTGYEVGWVVGGGVEVVRVSVQARYMRGIRQIARDFNVGQSVDSDSTAFAVILAFRLN
jgi:opacity protein-like surface antigen